VPALQQSGSQCLHPKVHVVVSGLPWALALQHGLPGRKQPASGLQPTKVAYLAWYVKRQKVRAVPLACWHPQGICESIDQCLFHAKAQRTRRSHGDDGADSSTESRAIALRWAALRGSPGWLTGPQVHLASPARPLVAKASGTLQGEWVFAVSSLPAWRRCKRSKP